MHTLLVSSDSQYKELLERVLRSRGHRVLSCHSVEAAWHVHSSQQPALIFVVSASEEAFDFCRRVRAGEDEQAPTVALAVPPTVYDHVPDDLIVFPLEGMHSIQSGIAAAEQEAFQLRR